MHLSVEGLRPWDWSYPVMQYLREWPPLRQSAARYCHTTITVYIYFSISLVLITVDGWTNEWDDSLLCPCYVKIAKMWFELANITYISYPFCLPCLLPGMSLNYPEIKTESFLTSLTSLLPILSLLFNTSLISGYCQKFSVLFSSWTRA